MCQNNSIPFEQVIQSLMQLLEEQGYSAAVLARNRRISEVMRDFLRKNLILMPKILAKILLSFAKLMMCQQKQEIIPLYSPNV